MPGRRGDSGPTQVYDLEDEFTVTASRDTYNLGDEPFDDLLYGAALAFAGSSAALEPAPEPVIAQPMGPGLSLVPPEAVRGGSPFAGRGERTFAGPTTSYRPAGPAPDDLAEVTLSVNRTGLGAGLSLLGNLGLSFLDALARESARLDQEQADQEAAEYARRNQELFQPPIPTIPVAPYPDFPVQTVVVTAPRLAAPPVLGYDPSTNPMADVAGLPSPRVAPDPALVPLLDPLGFPAAPPLPRPDPFRLTPYQPQPLLPPPAPSRPNPGIQPPFFPSPDVPPLTLLQPPVVPSPLVVPVPSFAYDYAFDYLNSPGQKFPLKYGKGPERCPKPKKRERKEPEARDVCFQYTVTQKVFGTSKSRRRKVPCQ